MAGGEGYTIAYREWRHVLVSRLGQIIKERPGQTLAKYVDTPTGRKFQFSYKDKLLRIQVFKEVVPIEVAKCLDAGVLDMESRLVRQAESIKYYREKIEKLEIAVDKKQQVIRDLRTRIEGAHDVLLGESI